MKLNSVRTHCPDLFDDWSYKDAKIHVGYISNDLHLKAHAQCSRTNAHSQKPTTKSPRLKALLLVGFWQRGLMAVGFWFWWAFASGLLDLVSFWLWAYGRGLFSVGIFLVGNSKDSPYSEMKYYKLPNS